jgi:hypothetical protein
MVNLDHDQNAKERRNSKRAFAVAAPIPHLRQAPRSRAPRPTSSAAWRARRLESAFDNPALVAVRRTQPAAERRRHRRGRTPGPRAGRRRRRDRSGQGDAHGAGGAPRPPRGHEQLRRGVARHPASRDHRAVNGAGRLSALSLASPGLRSRYSRAEMTMPWRTLDPPRATRPSSRGPSMGKRTRSGSSSVHAGGDTHVRPHGTTPSIR